jgi:hypothetical protein
MRTKEMGRLRFTENVDWDEPFPQTKTTCVHSVQGMKKENKRWKQRCANGKQASERSLQPRLDAKCE